MSLYNVKRADETFRVTKFTDDLDVEETNGAPSSYLTTRDSCECPAGHRNTCRHREMLPEFISRNRVNSQWFLDWDNHQWFYHNSENGEMTTQAPRPSWRRF